MEICGIEDSIKIVKNMLLHSETQLLDYEAIAIETLLTAYEKEKNKESKWKSIKDYNRKKYDWVLVKYFDGDYECVPEVAERRNDGKWYTSERQIPFEVKYFFDMQEILEEEYNNVK